ncbi:unnamed protein product [Paramecium pentaurelia]|uniref:Uncharacterized protein n=1 Tax=Paramecium pentaurelia TaxID=43138 RepID=A0A8S1SUU3_9CILI|nr:unnamed protein product [Paramecium pentaurelia]
MDNFYLQMHQQSIKWNNQSKSTCSSKEQNSQEFDWNDIEYLYQECQQQGQASNVTNIIKSSQNSELNLKMDQLVRTNNQSSLSEVNENQATLEINEDQKEKCNEIHHKPNLKCSNSSYQGHKKSFSQVILEQEKFKRYRNNKRSAKTLLLISSKRSLMTPLFKTNLQRNIIQLSINYLNSRYSKTLFVDKNILACELIVLAIQEYKKTSEFDQSLLKYSNFTLAYQLTSVDDYCDFSAQPSQKDSFIDNQFIKQDEDQQFQYIIDNVENNINREYFNLELNSKVNFRNLTLQISDTSTFGIDLFTIEITNKMYPTQIILLIEDTKNEIFYNLKFEENTTIQEIYNQLQRRSNFQYNKNECFFQLKYPCVNFNNQEPLDIKFPISILPIHWLIIKYKSNQDNLNDLNHNYGFSTSSIKSITSSIIQKDDQIDQKIQQMFNYQEYNLLKIENNEQMSEVIIGIDYFDFYYYYTKKKQQNYSFCKITKWMVQFLLQNHQSGQTKDYKRIQISSILQIGLKNNELLIIKYLKDEDKIKKIKFMFPQKNQEVQKMKMKEQSQDIQSIIDKLQFIIKERRKNTHLL